ncbi:hypothetical protein H7K45_03345 [Mycobacterium yunnanensis]|uniref:Uncharacterized protein n=1 Tax=Mycobacterium yunnanensis TaxID=368477 RepID=A0A9X2YXG4_9MYCO|nr:hypothetical protein [Mycobacterium yunnanensis]MCV7419565.1 hypothetical protein [Mycobacterium yunnanensis]
MKDESVFSEVTSLRADGPRAVLSTSALEVHVRVVDHLAHTTRSKFVTDEVLDTLVHGRVSTMAAIELSLAGWWRRIDGGYVVVDQELIDAMSRHPARRRIGRTCRRLWSFLNSESVIPL